jgi:hypothetical protein
VGTFAQRQGVKVKANKFKNFVKIVAETAREKTPP